MQQEWPESDVGPEFEEQKVPRADDLGYGAGAGRREHYACNQKNRGAQANFPLAAECERGSRI